MCILLEFIFAPDAHGFGNEAYVIGDVEIETLFFACKHLGAIVTDSDHVLRSGPGSLFQAVFAKSGTAFRKPAYGAAAAATRLRTVALHFLKRNPR